jgi:hypothetical protein
MDIELKSLYEKLKSLYDRFKKKEVELKDLIVIAEQIQTKELEGLDSNLKTEISNQLRNIIHAPTLSGASRFLYYIDDGMGKKDRIVKFLIFKTLVESENNNQETIPSGGKRTVAPAYKLNGEKVHLLINKKKIYRSVYVKGNGKAKYCKINYEFVLLSKLKNKII